jgi:hypothetical protein
MSKVGPAVHDVRHFVPTRDLDLSVAFYVALGWRENWRVDGLAEIELAGHRLFLQGYYAREWAENSMIHVTVDDADAAYSRARSVVDEPRFAGTRAEPPALQPTGSVWRTSGTRAGSCCTSRKGRIRRVSRYRRRGDGAAPVALGCPGRLLGGPSRRAPSAQSRYSTRASAAPTTRAQPA